MMGWYPAQIKMKSSINIAVHAEGEFSPPRCDEKNRNSQREKIKYYFSAQKLRSAEHYGVEIIVVRARIRKNKAGAPVLMVFAVKRSQP
jgi:hypothetical protein